MFKTLLIDWSDKFAMDDEREKLRMKEATNELANLIYFLLKVNLESEELPIEEDMQLVGEEIVDAEYKMVELMDMA
jgi:hypothetical protein